MDRKSMKFKSLTIFLALSCLSIATAKVINTNTKLPLEVKALPSNLSNTELLTSTNILTKLSSNEIDPNVHPIESSSPALAEEPGTPIITNEVVTGNLPPGYNPEVSPDVSPNPSPGAAGTNPVNVDDPNPINKFCKCSEYACDCCRSFAIPILPVRAPTCARIRYLGNEKMSIQLKYGDVVLVTRQVSGSKSPPICIPMPGGFNQFCGRVYGLAKGPNDFKACLGFELRADDDVEASLRVSCFRFGAQGFSVAEAEPLPPENQKDDEEDDDDLFGLGDDDEDDEEEDSADDDDDGVDLFDDDEDDDDPEYPSEQEEPEPDYGGFSVLEDIFSDGESKKLKGNVTQIKTKKTDEKTDNNTTKAKVISKLGESPSTKDMKLEDTNDEEDEDNDKLKKTKSGNEDDDEDEEENEEEDDEEDDDEEAGAEPTDKTESNNKIKKEKTSTFDYLLDFVSKLVKLF